MEMTNQELKKELKRMIKVDEEWYNWHRKWLDEEEIPDDGGMGTLLTNTHRNHCALLIYKWVLDNLE